MIEVDCRLIQAHHFRVGALKSAVNPCGLDVYLTRVHDFVQEIFTLDVPLSVVSSEHISLAHASLGKQTHLNVEVALGLGDDGCAGPMAD